jgi:ferric iron reductase protein FhuF
MKNDKMVLIAYHLLGSSTGAYIKWLVNELKMTVNKTKYKDAHLVMLPADTINPQAR